MSQKDNAVALKNVKAPNGDFIPKGGFFYIDPQFIQKENLKPTKKRAFRAKVKSDVSPGVSIVKKSGVVQAQTPISAEFLANNFSDVDDVLANKILEKGFTTLESLQNAEMKDLVEIKGIGEAIAKNIIQTSKQFEVN